ncbi:MAG: type I restriction-modification system subunit M N-terminal domain-containing protein [Synergistaceae bacterium]|nr:type I restriction-modification system subunit M N-terminal domain-containing protein [Synergistaceae bacterium]
MDSQTHNTIVSFIWGIADDCLRDVYVRGKYRDVILPMTVIRRLDAVLEDTKDDVLKMKEKLDKAGIVNQNEALCSVAKQTFCNWSRFRLKDLTSRASQQKLKTDFLDYLGGFSPNVQEILKKFKFHVQVDTMVDADILGAVIEKFVSPSVNLSPYPVLDDMGGVRLPALDNHTMGVIFEELIRRFNEENNEEAGEHFTPRDVVELMANQQGLIESCLCIIDDRAEKVVKNITNGIIEYRSDSNLTDTEQIPLDYEGGIDAFIKSEVLPYAPDAWVDETKTQIGYEISFTKHFYKPVQLRELSEIIADIRALEKETEGFLDEVLGV